MTPACGHLYMLDSDWVTQFRCGKPLGHRGLHGKAPSAEHLLAGWWETVVASSLSAAEVADMVNVYPIRAGVAELERALDHDRRQLRNAQRVSA